MKKHIDTEDYKILKIVGQNIQKKRIARNLTIKQLSQKTKIREEYLKKIEKGTAIRMSTKHLFIIAEILNTKASCLFRTKKT